MPIYDRQGHEIGADDLIARQGTPYMVVAADKAGEVLVLTLWIGIAIYVDGVPMIFDTVIFGGRLDGRSWEYPTEEAALAGHEMAVMTVRAAEALSLS